MVRNIEPESDSLANPQRSVGDKEPLPAKKIVGKEEFRWYDSKAPSVDKS